MTTNNEKVNKLRNEIQRSEGELAKMKEIAAGMDKKRAVRHGTAVDDLEFKLQDAKLHLNTLLEASEGSRPEALRETEEILSDLVRNIEQARVQMEAG